MRLPYWHCCWTSQGADRVASRLNAAHICAVNLAEVASYDSRTDVAEVQVRGFLGDLPLQIIVADADLSYAAAGLAPLTRSAGLSLGDRYCLALAKRLGATALTGDRIWSRIAEASGAKIEFIR